MSKVAGRGIVEREVVPACEAVAGVGGFVAVGIVRRWYEK